MLKKKYIRYVHNMEYGAKIIHIPAYVIYPDSLFIELKHKLKWSKYKIVMYEKEFWSPRFVQVIHFKYDYKDCLPNLYRIKNRIEKLTNIIFNFAAINYYRNGNDYINYHADKEVKKGQTVVSISVGATRKFYLKCKFDPKIKHQFLLEEGDVLILNDDAISNSFKHAVPKMANVGPRINITFRE